jgi:Ca-activated chloride channel family protein
MIESTLPLLDDPRAPTAKDDRPGCGCLLVEREGRRLSLPLRSVSFAARVVERTAEVTVEQVFENTYAELLEAVYIFPLSGNAAVTRFELHVGGKQLLGIVEERGEARRQYQVALQEGRKAALLEQERDDVFTVKVGNLPPRERATIKMVVSERLPAFDDGETELRIPLVVAPRYIPGEPLERPSLGEGTESDTTAVPDASRISPPRLAPGLRGDVALAISVELLGEDEVQDLGCTQHATKLGAGSGKLTIRLARKDELLDRDFVLRWKSAAVAAKPLLYVSRKGAHTYGLLSLVPPREVRSGAGARDVLFLLDRSGSMEGAKLDSARRALDGLLGTLAPHDRFAICAFDDKSLWFKSGWLNRNKGTFSPADAASLGEARRWLSNVNSAGGTELLPALEESLAAIDELAREKESEGRLRVVVLITDGQVGNEGEVLRRIESRASGLRVFTLGIDTAVNAAFLRRLAQIGRGTATLCAPGPELEHALARIGREIGAPVLVDVSVEDQGLGLDAATLTPERLPDLYAGRTASVFFRSRNATGSVRIRARRASGGSFDQVVAAEPIELASLPQLWAKSRVSDLEDRYRVAYAGESGGLEAARGEILEIALEHQLLTRFTAFIVVDKDEAERRLALPRRTIVQAVEQPAEWAETEAAGKVYRNAKTAMASIARPSSLIAPGTPAHAAGGTVPPAVDAFTGADAFAAAGEFQSDALARSPSPQASSAPRGLPQGRPASPPPPPPAQPGSIFGRLFESLEKAKAKQSEASFGGRDVAGTPAKPFPSLETLVESLGKELARVQGELEQGRWPQDSGATLEEIVRQTRSALSRAGLDARAANTVALLEKQLASVVDRLRRKIGRPQEVAELVRAASEALAAQARAELAPLLGKGGAFWEATI